MIKGLFDTVMSVINDKEQRNQFIRYVCVGGSSFLMELALFWVLSRVFERHSYGVVIANALAITFAFWFCFLLNRIWSFKSNARVGKQLLYYALLFAFNLAFSSTVIWVFDEFFGINPMIIKVLVMGCIVLWNFVLYRKVIYTE